MRPKEKPREVRILGIDPGSRITGYGVISQTGSHLIHLVSGVVRCPSDMLLPQRLLLIHQSVSQIVDDWNPDSISVENVFHGKNVKSLVALAHARAVIMLIAAQRGIPLSEYPPVAVKKASVGYGKASKEQVASMMTTMFRLPKTQRLRSDTTDALAIALCHLHHFKFESSYQNKVGKMQEGRMGSQ